MVNGVSEFKITNKDNDTDRRVGWTPTRTPPKPGEEPDIHYEYLTEDPHTPEILPGDPLNGGKQPEKFTFTGGTFSHIQQNVATVSLQINDDTIAAYNKYAKENGGAALQWTKSDTILAQNITNNQQHFVMETVIPSDFIGWAADRTDKMVKSNGITKQEKDLMAALYDQSLRTGNAVFCLLWDPTLKASEYIHRGGANGAILPYYHHRYDPSNPNSAPSMRQPQERYTTVEDPRGDSGGDNEYGGYGYSGTYELDVNGNKVNVTIEQGYMVDPETGEQIEISPEELAWLVNEEEPGESIDLFGGTQQELESEAESE